MSQDLQKYVRTPMTNSDLRTFMNAELSKIQQSTDTFFKMLGDLNMLAGSIEGDFIPFIFGQTTPGVGTYTVQKGRFLKIGRMVAFSLDVQQTAHTGTGNEAIGGLPYTISSSISVDFPVMIQNGVAPLNNIASTITGTTGLQISQAGHAAGQAVQAAIGIRICGIYFTDN